MDTIVVAVIAAIAAAGITAAYMSSENRRIRDEKRVTRMRCRISRLEDRLNRAYKWADKVTTWADTQTVSKSRTLYHIIPDVLHDDQTPWCWNFYRRHTVAHQLVERSRRLIEYVGSMESGLSVLEERYMRNYHPHTIRQGIKQADLHCLEDAANRLDEALDFLEPYLDGTAQT